MKFINVRELHSETAKILSQVARGEEIVVSKRGKPQVFIRCVSERDLERITFSSDILKASESSLEKDWLSPEEDEAWQNL